MRVPGLLIRYILRLSLLVIPVLMFLPGRAQQEACSLRVSLLTCTPGAELYSTFGHTAIRVTDAFTDRVFNYGTFDFNEPNFYGKFVRGKLNYFLSVESFDDFAFAYQYEGRGITEQVLNLDCREREQLLRALIENARDDNRFYKYDFLFDNCTTRAGVIIRKHTDDSVIVENILTKPIPTFRNLLHQYLDSGRQYWSKLGIDLLLGSRIDRKVSNAEAQFLPDYLMMGFDSSFIRKQNLVSSSQVILEANLPRQEPLLRPIFVFVLLLMAGMLLTLLRFPVALKWLAVYDKILFSLLGLLGFLLLFMWTATDHQSCRDNYNLLWALPTHAVFIWLDKSHILVRRYFQATVFLSVVVLLGWPLLPQQINQAVFPLIALVLLRAYRLSNSVK